MSGPTNAVAVCRAGVALFSPVYQKTVLALVPLTSEVAVSNGGPLTRWGGSELKKLLAAAIVEAAGSAVWSRLETAPLSAVCRLLAVAAAVVPMANWLAPGGDAVVACSVMLSPAFGLEPSATRDRRRRTCRTGHGRAGQA